MTITRHLIALLALLPTVAVPQDPGRIMGQVVDEQTGDPISGASIMVDETGAGGLTNLDGRYLIRGVDPGVHDLMVQVIGYATKRVTGVQVASGGLTRVDISMASEALEIEAITVSAAVERGSTAALLNERRRSSGVADAIGSQQIARSPDGNAAAVMARAPGVSIVGDRYVYVRGLGDRYGAATLNGSPLPSPETDKKVVPLDIVPSSFLESIVTAKTYSPDQPGDYAGGLVQIRTRNFPARSIIKLGLGTSYNSAASFAPGVGYEGGAYDFVGFDDGTRGLPAALPDHRITAATYSAEDLERFGESFAGSWGPTPTELPLSQSFNLAVGNQFHVLGGSVPVGYLLAVTQSTDYGNRDDLVERVLSSAGAAEPEVDYTGSHTTRSAALGGLLNLSIEPAAGHRLSLEGLYNRSVDDEGRILQGYNHDFGTSQRNTRIRYLAQDLLSAQLKGEHEVGAPGGTKVGWRGSFTSAARYEPNTREVLYRQAEDGRYLFDTFVQSGSVFHSDLDEIGYGGGLDVGVPLQIGALSGTLSFGGAMDAKDREAYARRFRFLPVGFISEEVAVRQPDDLFTPETIGPEGFEIREATFPGDNYEASQEILAGYALVDTRILPRLRLAGGARVEQTRQRVTPLSRFTSTGMELAGAELDDTDILPGLNVTYEATESMNLRLGLSRTLARPQFRELAPFQFTDYAGGFLTVGNPALGRSRISNYDLRWEWFPGLDGLVAVSGFYKRFEDPIETVVLSSTELVQTWVNAQSATNYGVEVELQTSLGRLGPIFEPLALNANVTWVESEVSTGDSVTVFLPFGAGLRQLAISDRRRALQGQSPYMLNLGLTYLSPTRGTNVSALYNHIGRRIESVSGASLPDIYEESRGVLDLVLEQPFGNGISAKLSATKLLGSDVVFTQGGDVVRSYDTGRVVSLSVSWDLDG